MSAEKMLPVRMELKLSDGLYTERGAQALGQEFLDWNGIPGQAEIVEVDGDWIVLIAPREEEEGESE